MGAISGRDEPLSEEMIDATLADSFPAIRLLGHASGLLYHVRARGNNDQKIFPQA